MSESKKPPFNLYERIPPAWRPFARLWEWLLVLNFVSFIAGDLLLGGDAMNGHASNGHYFLVSHGAATEVSKTIFEYSWWHAAAVIFQFVASFAIVIFLFKRSPD